MQKSELLCILMLQTTISCVAMRMFLYHPSIGGTRRTRRGLRSPRSGRRFEALSFSVEALRARAGRRASARRGPGEAKPGLGGSQLALGSRPRLTEAPGSALPGFQPLRSFGLRPVAQGSEIHPRDVDIVVRGFASPKVQDSGVKLQHFVL